MRRFSLRVCSDGTEARSVASIECWGWVRNGDWFEFKEGCPEIGWRNRETGEFSGEQIELELLMRVDDGKNGKVTFDDFPCYLR